MWGSAILTANYLRNRSPCKSINFKSPYELKNNKLPALSHLKVFGCNAYPLILDKKQRNKFKPTALTNCVFVGYDERDGIYWIYNKSNRQIFRSRDVKFNENGPKSKNSNNNKKSDVWITMDYSKSQPSEQSLSDNVEEEGGDGQIEEGDSQEEESSEEVQNNEETETPIVEPLPQRKSSRDKKIHFAI